MSDGSSMAAYILFLLIIEGVFVLDIAHTTLLSFIDTFFLLICNIDAWRWSMLGDLPSYYT